MTEVATQVHAVETTGEQSDYDSYRTFRAIPVKEELQATQELYDRIDSIDGTDRTSSLNECRKYAWFARRVEDNHVHVVSNSCRLRWCPICSKGRTNYIIQSLTPWMRKVKVTRFLTLTMKHTDDSLSEQIATLYDHWRTLRKHKWFKKYVSGGVWFFQVTLSKRSDSWHPHLHCIVQGKYIPKMELSARWERITNGSKIVDIKLVKDPEETASYVARYSARPARLREYPLELRIEIYIAMHRRRLCGAWGSAKGISLSPPTKVDADKFTRVGSWSTVMHLRHQSEYAREILRAWKDGTPLADDVTLIEIDREIDNLPSIKFTESDNTHLSLFNLPP